MKYTLNQSHKMSRLQAGQGESKGAETLRGPEVSVSQVMLPQQTTHFLSIDKKTGPTRGEHGTEKPAEELRTGLNKEPMAGIKIKQDVYLSAMEEGLLYETVDNLDSTETTDTDEVDCATDKICNDPEDVASPCRSQILMNWWTLAILCISTTLEWMQ